MKNYPLVDLRAESSFIKKQTLMAISNVVASGEYILGDELELFEKEFAKYCGSKFAVGVANGTAALFLALTALGIGEGDEVITTAMSFCATAEAIIYTRAKPVFVDIREDNLSIDADKIEQAVTKKTKAILPVHLYGIPADIKKITAICKKYKLFFIEDCAQAHGALYNGKKVGTFGDIGCFSFMPAKNLGAYGDAGCITTDSYSLAEKIKKLRNHGRKDKYRHDILGFSERMDNLQAAVLRVKLKHLDRWNHRRREIAKQYNNVFKKEHINIIKSSSNIKPSYYVYTILIDNRNIIKNQLSKSGISSQMYYPVPLHLQPVFKFLGYKKNSLKVAENLSNRLLSIPMHPFLNSDDVTYISKKVIKTIKAAGV